MCYLAWHNSIHLNDEMYLWTLFTAVNGIKCIYETSYITSLTNVFVINMM